jgi:small subunit ribosomal protein S4e
MTRHQKRLSVPKSWPIERKTNTFTVKADAGPHGEAGVPLLILLRDVLGYVDTRKEARYALGQDSVLINGAAISDEERPIGMFDIIAFVEREEFYRVFPDEGGRLALSPLDEESAGSKLGKVVGKQQVADSIYQLTLHDGQTLRTENGSYAPKDSLVVDNESGEIVAHFPYEEDALVTAVAGSHAGEIGHVEEITITASSSPNNVRVESDNGAFETIEPYVVVIDENFTSDDGGEVETEDLSATADEVAEAVSNDEEAEAEAEDDEVTEE